MKSCLPRSELDAVGVGHGIHRFDYLLWDQFLSSLLHISTVDSVLVSSLQCQVDNLQSPEYKYSLSSKCDTPIPTLPRTDRTGARLRLLADSYLQATKSRLIARIPLCRANRGPLIQFDPYK